MEGHHQSQKDWTKTEEKAMQPPFAPSSAGVVTMLSVTSMQV